VAAPILHVIRKVSAVNAFVFIESEMSCLDVCFHLKLKEHMIDR